MYAGINVMTFATVLLLTVSFRCEGSRLKKRISKNVFKLCIRTCDTCDTCAHFYCPFGRGQTAIDAVNHAIFDAAEYRDISGSDIFTNVACVTSVTQTR